PDHLHHHPCWPRLLEEERERLWLVRHEVLDGHDEAIEFVRRALLEDDEVAGDRVDVVEAHGNLDKLLGPAVRAQHEAPYPKPRAVLIVHETSAREPQDFAEQV